MRRVPANRLLVWTGLIFVPAATLAAAMPSLVLPAWGLMLLFAALVLTDRYAALAGFAGISPEMPDVVRLSRDRDGGLTIRIRNEKQTPQLLRIGLPFPEEIISPFIERAIRLPGNAEFSNIDWPCKGLKQGRYEMDACYIEAASPLGFWSARNMWPVKTEIRVYPNLMSERQNLAALFLNRGIGLHVQRQVGKGREFEKLREYVPGDGYEDIHWKATARRGRPITQIYQIERTQPVYVVMDASRLSGRIADPDAGEETFLATVLDRYITAGLVMGLAAERQGDQFGLLVFSDRIKTFIRAGSGRAHYNACRDRLYTLEPERVTPDFTELFTFIATRIRRRSLLILLTHMDDPVTAETFVRHVDIIRKKHLVLVNMIRPAHTGPLFTHADVASENDLYAELGGHIVWQSLRETEKLLRRRGVGFAIPDSEKLCVHTVSEYLNIKRRQML